MARTKQRRIENRRERRQGKEITQRWIIAAQSRRGVGDEEEWWLKNNHQVQRRQAKRMHGNHTSPPDSVVMIDFPEKEEAPETENYTVLTDGRVVANLPSGPIGKKWFEGMKNVQPRRSWLLAILILPVIAVITLLIGFLTAYKKISSTHP